MKAKTIEIRDAATFMPALAIRLDPETDADRYLLGRAGFGTEAEHQALYVLLVLPGPMEAQYDPMQWTNRTRQIAHQYIIDHFAELEHGEVVDVQFILGETETPKRSERDG